MGAPVDNARILRFFDELLPLVVELRADLFDRVKGTLAVFVDGTGQWTVSFGDHTREDAINEGADLDADCVAVFSTPMFLALLDGKLEGTPVVIGDTRLVEKLGQLLQEPARGGVGARITNIASARTNERKNERNDRNEK